MTDNGELLELQKKIKRGENAALSLMYQKLYEIAYKTINTMTHKNPHIARLEASERQQKAHDAANYLIEQYLKRPAFEIEKSITGYLYKRVVYELYGRGHQRACDKIINYTDKLPEERTEKKGYCYLVKSPDGTTATYKTSAEIFLNPDFKYLRKCELVEAIRTGREWRKYKFDILEVNE